MKILFVAAEAAPFAKTGGLADVVGSLPKELQRMGHDVRLIIPMYKAVRRGGFSLQPAGKGLTIELDGIIRKGSLHQTTSNGMPVYFIGNRSFFDRDYLYGPPEGAYPDNHQRFAFFCHAVLEFLWGSDFRPDVIHCHDWQTALLPILLSYYHRHDPLSARMAVIYTIHNLAYQGLFPRSALGEMGLDASCFTIERLEYYGMVNLMKGGILTADLLTTVSPTYCREIMTHELGCGLEGVLQTRRGDLHGILNGVDYETFDPAIDREIPHSYSATAMANRALNKKELQKSVGLPQKSDTPLLGMVSRLTEQKGIDLVLELLPRLKEEGMQLIMLGAGDEKYLHRLDAIRQEGYPNIALHPGYDHSLGHQIYAGCDMFLMPSRYEPCGISQLIALRYGAVPVVRKCGGLADTVIDPQDNPKAANGFHFREYSADALWETIVRAQEYYRQPLEWHRLIRRGMKQDFSWQRSAAEYVKFYEEGIARKR